MRILLDTSVFIWWILDDPRLSPRARKTIGAGSQELYLSAASGWEMAIKIGLGKLHFHAPFESFLIDQLAINQIEVLPVQMAHAIHVRALPHHHKDPFDRLLVAQAQVEDLPLLTSDPQIRKYDIKTIWFE